MQYLIIFLLQEDDDQKMAIMRKAFQMFDTTKSGFIETLKISTILNTMGGYLKCIDKIRINLEEIWEVNHKNHSI